MTGPLDADEAVPTAADAVDSNPHPTVLDRPAARTTQDRAAVGTGTGGEAEQAPALVTATRTFGGTTGTVVSPIEALERDEMIRTRNFCFVGLALAVGAGIAVLVLPDRGRVTWIFLGAIAAGAASMVYLFHRTRTPATFKDGVGVAIAWYIPAAGCAGAIPYFGAFSPVPLVLVLGIYFTGLGSSLALAAAIYVTVAIAQAVSSGLVISGVIPEPGFIRADYLSVEVQIVCQVLVQLVLAATFVVARGSRRSTLFAVGELEAAVRGVAQREALLQEAREELRRALGGGRGRFSDHTIGNYRLGELIGRGAMGEVYDAVDTRTDQPVAMKMLSQTSLGNAHHVQRFLRELRTTLGIESAHVVRVLEIGEEPLPHLVMERLRGRDLAAILRDRRVMPHAELIELMRQAGAGITAAGAVGIVHRDIKPQNLFRDGSTWKVLDFGVSRAADTGDTLTSGHVIGTPAYMAPEQARGSEVDHRADLYALAAIAYRALTGHTPFSGREIADVLYRVVHTPPMRPTRVAKLPGDVDLVLAIGLAKNPSDRFPTADELADALAAALEGGLADSIRARGRALIARGAWI